MHLPTASRSLEYPKNDSVGDEKFEQDLEDSEEHEEDEERSSPWRPTHLKKHKIALPK